MPKFSVGDLVWVRVGLGDNEEPATVVELGCETPSGNEGIKCKIQVSMHEAIYDKQRIKLMDQGTRPRSQRSRRATNFFSEASFEKPSKVVNDKKQNKRKNDGDNNTTEKPSKKRKTSMKTETPHAKNTTASPHFDGKKTTSPHFDAKETTSPYFDGGKRSRLKKKNIETANIGEKNGSENCKNDIKTEKGKRKPKKAVPRLIFSNESDSSDGELLSTMKVKKASESKSIKNIKKRKADATKAVKEAKKKPIPKEKGGADNKDDESKKKSAKKRKPKAEKEIKKKIVIKDDGKADDDSEEEKDYPFRVEYSTTGRATCKRCDEIIAKGSLRVSHVPLFRGKPGYRVFRHLKCATFSEEIQTPQDVGGWKKLSEEDLKLLAQKIQDSKEEAKKEMEELDPDELVPVVFQGETRSPPPGLSANLLPFQVEGTSWMHSQEMGTNSGIRGGILADEMGMGKTLQTITSLLDNRPKLQHCKPRMKHPITEKEIRENEEKLWTKALSEWKEEMEKVGVPKSIQPRATAKKVGGGARAGTLVICPVIALTQWKTEIEKFTESDTLNVGIYHGPDRAAKMPRELMCKYDVVLTTYQVLEADFRKMTSPNKIKCPNCGGKFKIDKLRVHLKYFCGEGAQRTEAQARQRRSRDDDEDNTERGGKKMPKKGASQKGSSKKQKTFPKKQIRKESYDSSESELSDVDMKIQKKTSRRAAVAATKRMSVSKNEWSARGNRNDSEDSEDSEDFQADSSDEESEDLESDNLDRGRKAPLQTKAKAKAKRKVKDFDSDSDDDEIARARQKQREALALASSKGNKGNKGGKGFKKQKMIGKKKQRSKKNKSDDSDSDSDDEYEISADPMANIDMDALIKEAMAGSKMSPLHSFCWWRIVLDEAHMIKSRSSQTANAAFALIAVHRWCLSGTPLQNRVGEFYSLIRFLRIDPMAHYFCRAKGCDCKSLHYRMFNGRCLDCGHGSVQHFSYFNKHVLNPIQRAGYSGDGRRAMFKLKKEILDTSLLRRTKQNRAADMKLPPRLVTIRSVRLHPVEEDFYNALYTQTQSSFNDYVAEGTLLNNYAHIFDLLMRMRQAVDHPYLVIYSKKDMKARGSNGITVANGSTDCSICHETPSDLIKSSCCDAIFCRSCVQDYMAISREANSIPCPSCTAPFSIDLNQASTAIVVNSKSKHDSDPMPSLKELPNVATGSILRRIDLSEFATSSKIEALVEELVKMRESSPGSKAIVFSQFVNMLDLIRWRLHSDPCLKDWGLGARALHGGMNVKARDECLKSFKEDMNVRVLLMSLKAGGVALNLTVANNIYLMDPWWNPAAEYQAIDRTHRLGQYRAIRAVRFVSENTVEERILQLQEKKRLVFDGTIGRDAGSLKQLTVDDMKALFT